MRHGLFRNFNRLDRRFRDAKAIEHTQAALCEALGGKPSPQKSALIRLVSIGLFRLSVLERLMLAEPDSFKWDVLYMKWGRAIREELKALGLDEHKPPVPSLQEYLREQSEQDVREAPAPSG